jgi:type II secretory pathway component PulJ
MKRRQRLGKTLLEMVVIISIMSIVVGMSATSLAAVFRLRQQMSRDGEQAAALARLNLRLRQDAHEAKSMSIQEGCELQLADGRDIHYRFEAPNVFREVHQAGAVVHRDRFLMPRSSTAEFQANAEEPRLLRLVIQPVELPGRKLEMPRRATIEAAVNTRPALAGTGGGDE